MTARHLTAATLLAVVLSGCSEPPVEPPKLVVMVAVDQLRADLLDRYDDAFTGGFRRLLDEGAVFTGASHRHASTSTAIGHTTLSTGVFPTRHGIVGNSWVEQQEDGEFRSVYAVEDTLSGIVGFPSAEGRSPKNIMRTGLADWMQEQDPRTRVISISGKDRGAIPMAAQARGEVYWLMSSEGRMATSTYYKTSYPNWVERFNRERMPRLMGEPVWEYQVDEQFNGLARPDEAPYEGDGEHTVFPHVRVDEWPGDAPRNQFGWAGGTPASDRAVLEFTAAAMAEFELGQQEQQDFLAVSFSSTDYVGHGYGPLSREQLDNLLRVDRALGELMALLDERVGEGRWVLGLSADHGVLTMPEWLAQNGEVGYRTSPADIQAMRAVIARVEEEMANAPADEMMAALAVALETEIEWVEDVMLPSELMNPSPDSMINLYANSWNADRRHGLLPELGMYVRHTDGTLVTGSSRGTSHGSPYWYDRHVPLILFGAQVTTGRYADEVYTVDLAPSLAALAGIVIPTDLDGRSVVR